MTPLATRTWIDREIPQRLGAEDEECMEGSDRPGGFAVELASSTPLLLHLFLLNLALVGQIKCQIRKLASTVHPLFVLTSY
uniref:Uncharacterized protein n=1 Tax=Setaria digitata TaxID=48799 RepID=A0A915Q814_9BILA